MGDQVEHTEVFWQQHHPGRGGLQRTRAVPEKSQSEGLQIFVLWFSLFQLPMPRVASLPGCHELWTTWQDSPFLTSPRTQSGCPQHYWANVSKKKLRNLGSGELSNLGSITALNLERNVIQELEPGVFYGINDTLSSLSLLNNLLTSFPTEAITSLQELRVSGSFLIRCSFCCSHISGGVGVVKRNQPIGIKIQVTLFVEREGESDARLPSAPRPT